MQHAESIIISRPQAAVWALVGNPQSWGDWVPDVTDVRLEGGGAPSVGAALSYTWRGRRRDTKVTAFEAERVISITGSEKNYEFSETMAIRETFGGTGVTMTMGFKPTVWWASFLAIFMLPLKGLLLGRPMRKELQALRAAVEAQPAD